MPFFKNPFSTGREDKETIEKREAKQLEKAAKKIAELQRKDAEKKQKRKPNKLTKPRPVNQTPRYGGHSMAAEEFGEDFGQLDMDRVRDESAPSSTAALLPWKTEPEGKR